MASTPCANCGQEISKAAKVCPKCGHPKGESRTKLYTRLFIVLALIVWVMSWDRHSSPSRDSAADETSKEYAWMDIGKDSVRAILKDPDGAKFSNVFFHRGATGVPVSCGYVNAKNGFGGYSGNQRFISAGKPELTYLEEQLGDISELWASLCQ